MAIINSDLKEFLTFPEALSLLCYNINYFRKYPKTTIKKLSKFLNMPEDKVEKVCRIFEKIRMVEKNKNGSDIEFIMKDSNNDIVKNTIYEVIRENKERFSTVYRDLIRNEIEESIQLN